MHIPDGYLSPATCAVLYAGAAPFWYVARRVKRQLHTRLVPVLSLVAAFSFVIMMFNIPLPGGTTGHAVGVGLAVALRGPVGVDPRRLGGARRSRRSSSATAGSPPSARTASTSRSSDRSWPGRLPRSVGGGRALDSRRRAVAAGAGRLRSHQCVGPVHGGRVRHPADALPRCDRCAALLPVPARDRRSRDDARASHGRRSRRGRRLGRRRGVRAAYRSGSARGRRGPCGAERPGRARGLRPLWIGLGVLLALTPLGILAGGAAWGEWARRTSRTRRRGRRLPLRRSAMRRRRGRRRGSSGSPLSGRRLLPTTRRPG